MGLFHAVVALAYIALAGGVVLALIEDANGATVYAPAAAGLAVVVAAAFVHFLIAQIAYNRRLSREARALRAEADALKVDLADFEIKLADIAALATDGKVARSNAEIVSEMRVLRSLLTQLNARRGLQAANATGTAKRDVLSRTTEPLPVIQPSTLSDDEVLAIVRRALRENRVDLYVQPIVRLPQRNVQYYETYSRIRHDDGSILLPERYIDIAVAQGFISTIDNLLLFRAVQLVRRVLRDDASLGFFCNISRESLADREFFPQFVDFLEHNAELAPVLFFEFAQSDLTDPQLAGNLDRLRELGFGLSIDRVRTLRFDIGHLAARGVKFLKVEAETLMSERHQADLPVHIEDLTRAMRRAGISLIAEKIETESTVLKLADHNVDFGQGYLFGEPKPSRFER